MAFLLLKSNKRRFSPIITVEKCRTVLRHVTLCQKLQSKELWSGSLLHLEFLWCWNRGPTKNGGFQRVPGSTKQNETESTDLKVIWRFNILKHIPNIVCRWCSFFWLKEKKHFQVHIRPSFPMNPGNRVSWVSIRVFVWKCRKLGKKKTKSNALKLKFPVEMALSWG